MSRIAATELPRRRTKARYALNHVGGWLDEVGRRLLDFSIALLGVIILSPVFVFIGVLIKRDSPGPVFYWGERVGRNGRPFRILKFRTMYESATSYQGPRVTGQGDPRITALGQWLRDTKLNELPQLWNVLRGDMSLVGPRPEDREFVNHWPTETREILLSVRPGITSPASVLYRDEERLLQSGNVVDEYLRVVLPSKLRLDLLYVHHRSLLTDLDVLFWTVLALLPQLKTRRVPEHLLFWGPLARFISRYFSWFMLDCLSAFTAVAVTGVLWRGSGPLELGPSLAIGVAASIAVVFSLVNGLLGVGRIVWSKANTNDAFLLGLSTALTTFVLLALNQFWQPRDIRVPYLGYRLLPPGLIIVVGVVALVGFIATRYRMRIITGLWTHWITLRGKTPVLGERVLIIGAGEAGQMAAYLLRNAEWGRAFSVVGMVDDAPRKQGVRLNGFQVLGRSTEIPELVDLHDVGLIVFAIERIKPLEKERIMKIAANTPAQIVVLPDVMATIRAQLAANYAADEHPPTDDPLVSGYYSTGSLTAQSNGFIVPSKGFIAHNIVANSILSQGASAVDYLSAAPGLEHWLGELEDLVQAEAWDAAQAKIQAMKQSLVASD